MFHISNGLECMANAVATSYEKSATCILSFSIKPSSHFVSSSKGIESL